MNNLTIKIVTIFYLLFVLSALAHADNWRLDKDEEAIKVYTQAVQGSAIREIKAEMVISASLDSLMAVFDDIPQFPRWSHQCTKATLLKVVTAKERYHYQNINMPFPVVDRDLVIHSQIVQKGGNVFVHLRAVPNYCKQFSSKACDVVNESKNIMINHLKGEYQLTPLADNKIKVVWVQHTEPAGKLPNWLVNSLLIDVPFNTFKKLREQVKLQKYQQARLKRDAAGQILGF